MCFEGSNVLVLTSDYKVAAMFHLDEASRIQAIKPNCSVADVVCFQFENTVHILNLKTYSVIMKLSAQLFEWRYAGQFVVYDGAQLQLKTLQGETLLNCAYHVTNCSCRSQSKS